MVIKPKETKSSTLRSLKCAKQTSEESTNTENTSEVKSRGRPLGKKTRKRTLPASCVPKRISKEEKETCQVCDTKCNGVKTSIECDTCGYWFNGNCTQLTEREVSIFHLSPIKFTCIVCNKMVLGPTDPGVPARAAAFHKAG